MARGRRDTTWNPFAWQTARILNFFGAKITDWMAALPFEQAAVDQREATGTVEDLNHLLGLN